MSEPGGGHPRDRLSPYLDDELGVDDRSAIDRHLAACEDCRAELEALRRLARALADESVPAPSADLAARIGRRLDAGPKRRQAELRFAMPATIAATLAAIGILVAIQWRGGRLAPPAAPPPRNEAVASPREPGAQRRDAGAKKAETRSLEEPAHVSADRDAVESPQPAPEAAPDRAPAAVPGKAAGVAAPSFAARVSASSPCGERWFDSGRRATWRVAEVGLAARELERIARESGGIGVWRGPADGRPYLLLVPRPRFEEVVDALRSRGVTGLEATEPLPEGPGCASIPVGLQAEAPGSGPTPR